MFIDNRRKKRRGRWVIFFIFLISLISGGVYLYNSDIFEQNRPMIVAKEEIFWNLKKSYKFKLYDDVGVKNYNVMLTDGVNSVSLMNKTLESPIRELEVELEPPRLSMFFKKSSLKLQIEATDFSKWNFLAGNSQTKEVSIIVDDKEPTLFPISYSYGIRKGGSALVIFRAEDENLDELYIKTNFGKKFKPQKFYKDGYYISLVAWPVTESKFSATIVAKDRANNFAKSKIKFYLKEKRYRTSDITLTDNFLEGKISELFSEVNSDYEFEPSLLEKFKYINERVRERNEKVIEDTTSIVFEDEIISNFNIEPFYPLKNGAAVASFGDHRFFYYNEKLVSDSYHIGLDLASISEAEIKTNNLARVAYAGFNGIYGKMPILYHGLGLYSLYGHCTDIKVEVNDIVKSGNTIATTGKSGLALGDHLHFGILVQGVEVRVAEWMDRGWIKTNITDIIESAKKLIDRR